MRALMVGLLCYGAMLVVLAACGTDELPRMDCASLADDVAVVEARRVAMQTRQDPGWFDDITRSLGFAPDSLTAHDLALHALRQNVARRCDDVARLDAAKSRFLDSLGTQKLVAFGPGANTERFQELADVLRREIALLDSIHAVLGASHQQFRETLAEEIPEDTLLGAELARLDTLFGLREDGAAAPRIEAPAPAEDAPPDSSSAAPQDSLAGAPPDTTVRVAPETPPVQEDRRRLPKLEALLRPEIVFQDISPDNLRQMRREVRGEIARQDALVEVLRRSPIDSLSGRTGRERVQALGGLMRLEITLLDAAHTALKQSNNQFLDALAAVSQGDALASLHQDVVHLWEVFAALRQSNEAFVAALGDGGIGPLGVQARNERLREFGWQVRREIDLLGEVRTALERSSAAFLDSLARETSADNLRRAGYRIDQEVARLGDVYVVLARSEAALSKVRFSAVGDAVSIDSLRRVGQQIRQEATRQRRVLDALAAHGPLLGDLSEREASTEGIRELAWQMRQEIDLLGEVHTALRASNTAFLNGLVGDLQKYGGKLILAILVVILSFFLVRGLVWLLETLAERSAARRLFFKKLIPIGRLTVWGLTIYVVLADIFQLDQRGVLAAATALGVAIGFAAQDILKNIFGGILIIFDQPFQVGDKINVGGTYGEVSSIGLRSTRIVTPDDSLVSVPNSQVVDSQVANANAGALDCQVVVDLYLPGWVDVMLAKSIAYAAAANSKYVYLEKPIVVNVKDVFKETFLTQLKVKAYVLDHPYEFAFASDVTETAKAEFLRQGLFKGMESVPAPLEPPANGAPPAPSPLDVV